ncbi:MAG: HEAT repeat domain-containing protein [Planctomycetales bacterium]|nr:HEAT repeat domain-containing protein [Planctomycetales bacterium]
MHNDRTLALAILVLLAAGAARADLAPKEWQALHADFQKTFVPLPVKRLFTDSKAERQAIRQAAMAKSAIEDRQRVREARSAEREAHATVRAGRAEVVKRLLAADDGRALEDIARGLAAVNQALKDLAPVEAEFADAAGKFVAGLDGQIHYGSMSEGNQEWHKWALAELKAIRDLTKAEQAVKRQILDGLGARPGGGAIPWLLKALEKNPAPEVRAGAAQALGASEDDAVVPALRAAFPKEKDALARVSLLDALVARKATGARAEVLAGLADPVWEVRSAAVDAIEAFGYREADVVEAMIEALVKEDGRLRGDIEDVLHALTGMRFFGDGLLWRKWWADHKATFGKEEAGEGPKPKAGVGTIEGKLPDEPAKKGVAFYGIETFSKRIVFVLDRSGSMKEKAGEMPKGGPVITGGGHGSDPGGGPQGDTKLDVAQWELKKAVSALPSDAKFTMIFYNENFEVWKETLQPASSATKREALKYIDTLTPLGATNIFDSLERAFGIGMGGPGAVQDARYASAETADTIFLLSDGAPNKGRITAPDGILEEVRKMNRLRRIVVHTIGVGKDENRPFMKALADQNGGTYVHRD